MFEVGTKLRFTGVPQPDGAGDPRHLGDHDEDHEVGNHLGPNGCVRVPLLIGSVGTVVAHVPAEVDGAGTHEADCTVLTFGVEHKTLHHDGSDVTLDGPRNISFEDDQLGAWFEVTE